MEVPQQRLLFQSPGRKELGAEGGTCLSNSVARYQSSKASHTQGPTYNKEGHDCNDISIMITIEELLDTH
jgi:hypothetical protein